ncbi:hypothetical protein PGT21_004534 [Puccinia graminis f. sp. tritici]|uniref:Uncharacterized protein n=1 Tax=Puccinia graminis f. sp. tritici TaxID=56615 RepID=A0A5B0ND07_PUCGR|nr:hypothetical protein PGT21_004534 [Puccinia graminis f. sp. tritici]
MCVAFGSGLWSSDLRFSVSRAGAAPLAHRQRLYRYENFKRPTIHYSVKIARKNTHFDTINASEHSNSSAPPAVDVFGLVMRVS